MTEHGGGNGFSIGALAKRSGVKVQTVRYYEEAGLLPRPERSAGNQRQYDRRALDRLLFIRHGRALGFSLDDIRRLLRLADHAELSCEEAHAIATAHLAEVQAKIAHLRELETSLTRMATSCHNHTVADCRIIEALAHPPGPTINPAGNQSDWRPNGR